MVKTLTGRFGELRWGYRRVAELGPWSLTNQGNGTGTFTGTVANCDAFGCEQAPLIVVVPAGSSQWRWPVVSLSRDGANVTATLDLKE